MQPRHDSRIADAFGSRLEEVVRRLSREHITLGIILLVLGVLGFQISPWLAWFTIGTGVLLLTWHSRMRGTYRGLLYFFAIGGLSVVGLLMAGWSSYNKYSLLGGLRSAAQVVSYEIPLTLSVVGLILLAGTMSLNQIVMNQGGWFTDWYIFRQPLGFLRADTGNPGVEAPLLVACQPRDRRCRDQRGTPRGHCLPDKNDEDGGEHPWIRGGQHRASRTRQFHVTSSLQQ